MAGGAVAALLVVAMVEVGWDILCPSGVLQKVTG